jgi:L-malate glycosyltransferase
MITLASLFTRLDQLLHYQPKTARRPINVCFVIDQLSRAGTETQLLGLIRHLDQHKVKPHLVLLGGINEKSIALEPTNCPVLRLGVTSLLSAKTLQASFQFASFLRTHRIDIVQSYFQDSSYFAIPVARLMGIKKIIRVRNNAGYAITRLHRSINRGLGLFIDRYFTNSEAGAASFRVTEKAKPRQIEIFPNGLDLSRFPVSKQQKNTSIQRIGMVANLRGIKNIDGLIRAAKELARKHPSLRYEVAGDGPDRQQLQAQIDAANLTDRFHLLGSIVDVPDFLNRQDIAILCSHSESLSNSLLEYMAAGKAIVATDVGAARSLIQHGRDGLIVPPRNDLALALAIERYVVSPTLALDCGKNARYRVEKDYDWQQVAMKYVIVFQKLCDSQSR